MKPLRILFSALALLMIGNFLNTGLAQAACPPQPAGWPITTVERANFCVYYDNSASTLAQATQFADDIESYEAAYSGYGWPLPVPAAGKYQALLDDNGVSCNGGVSPGTDEMSVFEGCESSNQLRQLVAGHELAHLGPQLRGVVNNFDALWFHEGMARSGEDKVFLDIDNWPTALLSPFSYNKEVNQYLLNTNRDITSVPLRYESALWWTYFAEQCGSVPVTEPGLGVADSFGQLWTSALTQNDLAALNNALSILGCPSWHTMFPGFVVALYTKDLSGLPDPKYNFVDEDEPGNPAPYGPLAPAEGGTISTGSPANWNNALIRRYGAAFYKAEPNPASCPVITAKFHNDNPGTPAFYHVVTQESGVFKTHVQGSGDDWSQAFLNDGVTEIMAAVGSLQNQSPSVDVELSCADPVLDIKLPNSFAVEYVGPFNAPDQFVLQLQVTDGSGGPVVGGLTNGDFSVEIGGNPSLVVGGGPVQEQYFLKVQAANQAANGPYDLEVFLEEPGGTTVIASDLEVQAVQYDTSDVDNVLVIDRSGSMLANEKMQAAKDAANFFTDVSNSSEGLSVVPYNHNVAPTPVAMDFANLAHRTDAQTLINGLTASGATSIGDGLAEAVAQRAASPTGNLRCQFTLMSDGMENSSQFWADVQTTVVATGCPVMTIAFGPDSNEVLMQTIAAATGGGAYYNDVFTSLALGSGTLDDMYLDMSQTYLSAHDKAEKNDSLLAEKGSVATFDEVKTHTLMVDSSVEEALFALDWVPLSTIGSISGKVDGLAAPIFQGSFFEFELTLESPSGVLFEPTDYSFANARSGHVGYRVTDPEVGEWQMHVHYLSQGARQYQVFASGKSGLSVDLLLSGQLGTFFATGDYVPLFAILSSPSGPVLNAKVQALVTAPDGTETMVVLTDDGLAPDAVAGDGVYAGQYSLVNQSLTATPTAETDAEITPDPVAEASYKVELTATGPDFQREALGSFAVLAGPDDNNNGVPDNYEDVYGPATGDPDLDFLLTGDEYVAGTLPTVSDTDGGGENDWSEVQRGSNPLLPSDDQIPAPEFFNAVPVEGGDVVLTYDVKPEFDSVLVHRANSSDGPWQLLASELPLTGSFTDTTTTIGTEYWYKLRGKNNQNRWSAVLDNQATAASDPVPPEGFVILDDDAEITSDLIVEVKLLPKEGSDLNDIVEIKISNDPNFDDDPWQPFDPTGVSHQLSPGTPPGSVATVYVLLKDDDGNESVGPETDSIIYDPNSGSNRIFLPIIIK